MPSLLNSIFSSLQLTCICVLSTMGLTLIFRTSFTANFAQGSIAALGCYLTANGVIYAGMNLYLGLFLGVIVGTAFSVFVDLFIFRSGRSVNLLGKQIITMGLVSLIVNAIPLIFGTQTLVNFPLFAEGHFSFLLAGEEVSIEKNTVVSIVVTAVVVGLIFVLLKFSKWGLGVRATASNEFVAGMMGINTHAITAVSWGIAGALGVLSAILLAGTTTINPLFMSKVQVNAFLAGILGGFATFYGPIVAAVILPLLTSFIGWTAVYQPAMSKWSDVIIYVLVLLVVLVRPQGLFGKKIEKKV